MKKLILGFILIYSAFFSNSQELIIKDSINLKKGIYLDFTDFKYNSPSIPLNSEIWSYSRSYGFLNSKGKIDYYFINIHSKIVKEIGYVFGFCDGKNIYINSNINTSDSEYGFVKVDYLGYYCYFEDRNISVTNKIGYSTNNSISQIPTITTSLTKNVIDFNTGELILLNKKNIIDLIKSDTKLIDEFSKLKRKDKYLKECITKYNQRQKEEYLKQILEKNIEAEYAQHQSYLNLILNDTILHNLDKNENFDDYSSRILSYLKYPSFVSIKKIEEFYENGKLKYCGMESQHLIGNNGKQVYKIGTWTYYYNTGELKKIVDFDLWGIENGRMTKYDVNGLKIKESEYY